MEDSPAPAISPDYVPTIPNMLAFVAEAYGGKIALQKGGRSLTFAELEDLSALFARGLLAKGVSKGWRVGLLLPNSPEFVALFMAVTRIGATIIPLSTLYKARELLWVMKNSDMHYLIIADKYLRHDYVSRLEEAMPNLAGQLADHILLGDVPYLRSITVWSDTCDRSWASKGPFTLIEAAEHCAEIDTEFLKAVESSVVPADPMCMIYTSGSTANPKGVVHLQGNMIRHTYQMGFDYWPFSKEDSYASSRPFFWVAGLSATLFHGLHTGATLVIPETSSPAEIRELIDNQLITGVSGTAAWVETLNVSEEFADGKYRLYRLNNDCAGVVEKAEEGFKFLSSALSNLTKGSTFPLPGNRIPKTFGMTEMLGAHSTEPAPALIPEEKTGANGRGIPGVIRKVIDPETGAPVPPGSFGELCVGGYSLMAGIYKKERSETFEPDGLYRTGDLCAIDEDGYLTFKSRIGEMLKVSGANVAPLEVEACLNEMPEIETSAVVGIPKPDGDTLLVAAVTLRGTLQIGEESVIDRLSNLLSSFKVPKHIFFLTANDLPVTGSGKIKKADLVTLLAKKLS
ncbi:MAG: class I adenylate-forming enzyme family protein [Candidatus Thorarchaeota archaeon]